MNRKIAASVTIMTLAISTAAFASGPNGQQGKGNGNNGACTSSSVVRPVDSQRRDGTFQTTGTTANGSTVRPGNGKGLMDGTGPRK
jgi:hypothetical protein